MALSISHRPPPPTKPPDPSLRGYPASNADIVTRVTKPVHMADIGALSAQSDQPIFFENIIEKPNFRLCDILVKTRRSQARALGSSPDNYLRTLAYRLRQPPRGFNIVKSAPVKEVVKLHNEADWTELPIPFHKDKDEAPYVTAMNIIRDPETGFYNSCHAGTHAVGPRRGLISFVTPHSHVVMRKYRDMGMDAMPIAFVFGVPPAYEIMANFSGLHMDAWGEMEMVGTIMDRDIDMVPCETLELNVPAEAEIVVEGRLLPNVREMEGPFGEFPQYYGEPGKRHVIEVTAVTQRKDALFHTIVGGGLEHLLLGGIPREATLLEHLQHSFPSVRDVRLTRGGTCRYHLAIKIDKKSQGEPKNIIMGAFGGHYDVKQVVVVDMDVDIDDEREIEWAVATRFQADRDLVIVSGAQGSRLDPSSNNGISAKMGLDATKPLSTEPMEFTRIHVKGVEDVDLGEALQQDPKATFARIMADKK